jgi:hypothetical protein
MNDRQDRYSFGWTDYRSVYGTPSIQTEFFYVSWWWRFKEVLAWVMLFLSLTMVFVPMAWVELFMLAIK